MTRVAVLGAGVAGLAAASALDARGVDVVVLDKGRGPGGRTSLRRGAPFAFDHGAQYFTARDPRFRARVEAWVAEGVVAPWAGRVVALADGTVTPTEGSVERFVGVPGMNALAKRLAHGLDVRSGVRVDRVARADDGWHLLTDGGRHGPYDRLVCTLPAGQAATLLDGHTPLVERAAGVDMQPCWAVLLGLAGRYEVPFDGAFVNAGALSWVARDSSKPGRRGGEAWVLHARPAWTRAHWEDAREDVVAALSSELERATGASLPDVAHADSHRWRYALADPPLEEDVLVDEDAGVLLAGDWCHGGRVEGAFLSGTRAAERVLPRR